MGRGTAVNTSNVRTLKFQKHFFSAQSMSIMNNLRTAYKPLFCFAQPDPCTDAREIVLKHFHSDQIFASSSFWTFICSQCAKTSWALQLQAGIRLSVNFFWFCASPPPTLIFLLHELRLVEVGKSKGFAILSPRVATVDPLWHRQCFASNRHLTY